MLELHWCVLTWSLGVLDPWPPPSAAPSLRRCFREQTPRGCLCRTAAARPHRWPSRTRRPWIPCHTPAPSWAALGSERRFEGCRTERTRSPGPAREARSSRRRRREWNRSRCEALIADDFIHNWTDRQNLTTELRTWQLGILPLRILDGSHLHVWSLVLPNVSFSCYFTCLQTTDIFIVYFYFHFTNFAFPAVTPSSVLQ